MRDARLDEASKDKPLAALVRELCSSLAGTLNFGTQADHCIAKRITASPESLAQFMVFADQAYGGEHKEQDWKTFTSSFLKALRLNAKDQKSTEKRGEATLTLGEKAQCIFEAIGAYETHEKQMEALYGKNALVRVLNGGGWRLTCIV